MDFVCKGRRPAGFYNINGKNDFIVSSNEIKKCNITDFDGEYLIFGDGGFNHIHYVNGKFSASDYTYITKALNENILLKYIYYFLLQNIQFIQNGFNWIEIQNVNKSYLQH